MKSDRKQLVILQALWTERWKRLHSGNPALLKDASESRDARLQYCAQVVGHVVESASNLTPAELSEIIVQLKAERPAGVAFRRARSANVVSFPNRNRVTERQVWKIRQIENYLQWDGVPERLAGFLQKWYRVRRPEHLSFQQAIRAIDGLFNVAAQESVKALLGAAHQVTDAEKRAAVQEIKTALEKWEPKAGMSGG